MSPTVLLAPTPHKQSCAKIDVYTWSQRSGNKTRRLTVGMICFHSHHALRVRQALSIFTYIYLWNISPWATTALGGTLARSISSPPALAAHNSRRWTCCMLILERSRAKFVANRSPVALFSCEAISAADTINSNLKYFSVAIAAESSQNIQCACCQPRLLNFLQFAPKGARAVKWSAQQILCSSNVAAVTGCWKKAQTNISELVCGKWLTKLWCVSP